MPADSGPFSVDIASPTQSHQTEAAHHKTNIEIILISIIESASMFLKLSLRIAVSFVVMDYGNRPRGSVESSVKPC